jgi:hypothetical protein
MEEGFLKLTNHKEHPTNKAFKVFFFYKKIQAEYFENELKIRGIIFEKGEETTNNGLVYLYGIRKTDNREVSQINYTTLGKFRTPFITKKWVQYLIIIIGILIVSFAIFSYSKNT